MPENIKLLLYELKCDIKNNCRGSAIRTLEKLEKEIKAELNKTVPYGLRFKE